MKRFILTMALILCLAVPLYGETLTLGWGASTSPDVQYYNIYQSTTSGSYTPDKRIAQVASNIRSYKISNVASTTTLYWLITATDYDGNESVGYELSLSTYRKCIILWGKIFTMMQYGYSKSNIAVKK